MNIADELMCLLLAVGISPADDLSVTDILHLRHAARCAWVGLTPHERKVLRLRVGFSLRSRNITHVAEHFGITSEEVKRIEEKARYRYRHPPGGPNDGASSRK